MPPAQGKIEGQAAKVFGVAVRYGKEIAFRFGNTTAPLLQNRAFFFFRVGIKQERTRARFGVRKPAHSRGDERCAPTRASFAGAPRWDVV